MNYTEQQLTAAVVSDGLRPAHASLKLGVLARILSLIERRWDGNPQNRPFFDDIVLELNVVLQQTNGVEEGEISPLVSPIASENVDATSGRSYQENISWLTIGEVSSKEAASIGAKTTESLAGALPRFLQEAFCSRSSDPSSTALVEAFIKTDGAFRKEFRSQCKSRTVLHRNGHPGCTAISALIVKDRLFVANAGDCKAILCRAGHPYA